MMKAHVSALGTILLFAISWLAQAQHANDNGVWIVAGGGKQPERYVALVDENSMRRTDESTEIKVRMLFESINRPEELSGTFLVDCARETMVTRNIKARHRDGTVENMHDEPERKPRDLTEHQVLRFVCDHGKDGRQRIFPQEKNNTDRTSFFFIGQDKTNLPASNYVRDVLWSNKAIDAIASSKQSMNEIGQELERAGQNVEYAKRGIERRKDQWARAQNRKGRNSTLSLAIGMSESDFVERYGAPNSYRDGPDGNRWLIYHDAQASGLLIGGSHMTNYNALRCTVIVLIFEGKVHDYSTDEGGSTEEYACKKLLGF